MNSNGILKRLKERFEQQHEVRKRSLALHRTLSGRKLAEEIAESNPTLVLDLGCGSNEFKKIVPNVIGVLVLRRLSCVHPYNEVGTY